MGFVNRNALLAFQLLLAGIIFAYCVALIRGTIVTGLDGQPTSLLFDDMMISLRYARDLVDGHGLVWNAGEYVEGFTNPLWTMVFAAIIKLSSPSSAPLIIQIFDAFVLASACFTILGLVARRTEVGQFGASVASLVVATLILLLWYPAALWTAEGAEPALCLFIAALAMAVHAAWSDGSMNSSAALARLGWLAGIAWLVRPDTPIVVIPFFGAVAIDMMLKDGARSVGAIGRAAIAPAGILILSTAARVVYYGAALPNTYVLKMVHFAPGQRLGNGIGYISFFLAENWLALLAFAALAGLLRLGRRRTVPLVSMVVLLILYQVYVGGDPWIYWRMLVPVIAPIAYLTGLGMRSCLGHGGEGGLRRALIAASILALVIGLWQGSQRFHDQMLFAAAPYTTKYNEINLREGEALQEILTPDATIAVTWAGTIPYVWNGNAIDLLGKADAHIANLPALDRPSWYGMYGVPGHNKYDFQYSIAERRPDYVQTVQWGYENATDRPETQAFIAAHYAKFSYKGITVCLLKDSPRVLWDKVSETGAHCGS